MPVVAGYTAASSSELFRVALARYVAAAEDCTNCGDDDGDELVDLNDPECCSSIAKLGLKKVEIHRPGPRATFRIAASLAGAIDLATPAPDMFFQTRQGDQVRCAVVAGKTFAACRAGLCSRARTRRAMRVSGGFRQVRIGSTVDGTRSVEATGRGSVLDMRRAGEISLTIGWRAAAGDPGSLRCDSVETTLRWTERRSLHGP
jgi:hypothetical protein